MRLPILTATLAAAGTLLSACGDKSSEPLVPGAIAIQTPTPTSATVATSIAVAVKVTTTRGTPVPNSSVTFAVGAGGGSLTSAAQTTDAQGVATLAGWTLGTTAGTNTLTATVSGVTPLTVTVTGTPAPAARLGLTSPATINAVNRQAFASQPSLQLQDAYGNAVSQSGTTVAAAITTGGGTLSGTTTASTNSGGVATFTDLSIAGTVGTRSITFTAVALTSASVNVTTSAGAAFQIAVDQGNGQNALPGAAVSIPPSVKVTDADANAVSGVAVTFAVASGGGSVTGASQTTNSSGIATVGSWTMGSSTGANTMTATSGSLTGSPVTFTATATNSGISSIEPATLTPGITATITGQGFGATVAENTVTIDGVGATVTAASATQLTVTVPTTLACAKLRDVAVAVQAGGSTVSKNHPLRVATARTFTPGTAWALVLSGTEARCNEIAALDGLYYVSVSNTSSTYSVTGAPFEFRGTGASAFASPADAQAMSVRLPRRPAARAASQADAGAATHARVMDENRRTLLARRGESPVARAVVGPPRSSLVVGDTLLVRIPKIQAGGFCSNYREITARVAYMGTKAIVLEDKTNPMAGTIDSTYQLIGEEFDQTMFGILETNYGNPLAMDAATDNNGRIFMVFSKYVNDSIPGIAGFVVSCDFFPRATLASSNFGEYFYATVPTVPGTMSSVGTPPRWRWSMRGTIIHEAKHITSMAERVSRNASTFEESWLEETTARMSEELYERQRYGFLQRGNTGYGDGGNPVGPYCGVRGCNGQPRGIVRVFEELYLKWYQAPHSYSPLGRLDASDFSFYATGWSLLRWALDRIGVEATILKAMTQDGTRSGVANFEQHLGITLANALPYWTLAMAVDDHPSSPGFDASVTQPSWNFRSVMQGLHSDFSGVYGEAWPLQAQTISAGTFSVDGAVVPGTAAIVRLTGTGSVNQLLELKASGSSAAAPASLRLAILKAY